MIFPVGAGSFNDAMIIGDEVYRYMKTSIEERKYGQDAGKVGLRGRLCLRRGRQKGVSLDVLMDAIKKPGHEDEVKVGTDVASSEFHRDGEYDSGFESPDSSPEMQKRRRSST